MLSEKLLELLEMKRLGRLSPEGLEELSAELERLPEGEEELAAYVALWDGLDALREEGFREKIAAWSAEWKEVDEAELVEWYLAGELSETSRERLDRRMANDAAFARRVAEHRILRDGFAAARARAFEEKMAGWENDQKGTAKIAVPPSRYRSRRRWVAAAAAVLLLIAAGSFWFGRVRFSDAALTAKFYQTPPTGATMGAGSPWEEAFGYLFADAHKALRSGQFTVAAEAFLNLEKQLPAVQFKDSTDAKYYRDNVAWNLLLSRLGQGDIGGDFATELGRIADDPNHLYQAQAEQLRRDLASIWRAF